MPTGSRVQLQQKRATSILTALPTATFAYSGKLINGLPVILGSDQLHTTSADTNVTGNDVYNSNQVTDTTPPAVPMGLVAESGQDSSVPLSWSAVTTPDLASYKIYIDGVYANTLPATQTSYVVHGLTNGIQYSFQISVFDLQSPSNESLKSTEATATPKAPTVNRALLVVTLVNGLEKEYDLSMTEVNAFITWYNGRAEGTGSEVYAFNKTFNLAYFLSRKDYIALVKLKLSKLVNMRLLHLNKD
ncbi:fibronectin type III domain-containing protein [Paenibacillus oryzisoli]|uniref:Fibronectin type-III domain-containing protein n=1 Tax=Paenibacillus oryzisoli TaxID=1850517 RepID=A0A198A1L5_9BACL|nr:fibronectin type III domain-containing protein [Paenibacillus oryzisoli]OAS14992.1 hypothetical protein A8708_14335 [Paenibacillus oryzisoli]